VEYEQYLITTSISKLSKIESDNEEFSKTLFSIDSFYGINNFKDYSFYLPTDGDLLYFLKKNIEKIPEVKELLTRKYLNKALWKTKAEFSHYLSEIDDNGRKNIYKQAEKYLNSVFKSEGLPETTVVKEIKIKTIAIQKDEIFIDLDGEDASFTNLFPEKDDRDSNYYFIPFIPIQALHLRKKLISGLRQFK